jgi:hypothetical protein
MAKDDNSEGCGCSLLLYGVFGTWALGTIWQATSAFIRSVEQFFRVLVNGVESWWLSLIHTPYFHLSSVILASIAIGLMIGWAIAFRTRLPTSAVED